MTRVSTRPDHRTPEQIRADEEIAAAAEAGELPGDVQYLIPLEDQWALRGVLFAQHLGFAKNFHREHRLKWEDGFRRDLIERYSELKALLASAHELTPEIERVIREAATDYRARFEF